MNILCKNKEDNSTPKLICGDYNDAWLLRCHNCDACFTEMEQTDFQHKHGECPYCHSDDVIGLGTYD